jgi:wobble nucleotide-excising tRNase
MAFKVVMQRVASYIHPSALETDKKVTLIYGLNGAGKSTLSNFLYEPNLTRFAYCAREGINDNEVAVYNSKFVRDNFYEIDKLTGIFTLSKQNKDAEVKIDQKDKAIRSLKDAREQISATMQSLSQKIISCKSEAEDSTWKIKTKYSGGDRVLEYCLKGLMQAKGRLFEYVSSLPAPTGAPLRTIEILRSEVESIKGDDAKPFQTLQKFKINAFTDDFNKHLGEPIIGNKDSPVAGLIEKLQNGDWVNRGLKYVDILHAEGSDSCPFCQSKTLNDFATKAIRDYFDETFESSIGRLNSLKKTYETFTDSQPKLSEILEHPLATPFSAEIEALYGHLQTECSSNLESIKQKLYSPSANTFISDTNPVIEKLNSILDKINTATQIHNQKLENKENALSAIKDEFWQICRYDYTATIDSHKKNSGTHIAEIGKLEHELVKLNREIDTAATELAELQKQTVNVDDAVNTINSRLGDLGIDSFKIKKFEESRYRVSRDGSGGDEFLTLSEGEKTVISFLYFIEQCKGKRSPTDTSSIKTVVIDDPISSLSHLYVFNIGQLIKDEFSNSKKFDHIIILTHSLYFFYELADMNKERRDASQKLVRIIKNSSGSSIVDMKYEEIQNDYQAYWNVVKDEQQHPALIANCMRNIIEYFFNFIKKLVLSNVFQQPSLKDPKHLAFCRFMNRESHSLGQNIFDLKEFDYARFKEAFKLVFAEAGYLEHYQAMTK